MKIPGLRISGLYSFNVESAFIRIKVLILSGLKNTNPSMEGNTNSPFSSA